MSVLVSSEHDEVMEEIVSIILRGCDMARRMESDLPNMSNQMAVVYCREIATLFGSAAERIGSLGTGSSSRVDAPAIAVNQSGEEDPEVHGAYKRRRDGCDIWTVRVPTAPGSSNPDIPPDDGYTWRKYGQKDIRHSRYPRSYYRCTHKNFYGCDAKKQVQRLDSDPSTYVVTYRGNHTCRTSTTPLPIPPQLVLVQPIHADLHVDPMHEGMLTQTPPTPLIPPPPPSSSAADSLPGSLRPGIAADPTPPSGMALFSDVRLGYGRGGNGGV